MEQEIIIDHAAGKREKYESLLPQIKALIAPEPNRIANLANIAAVLKSSFNFWWVGFYLFQDNELVLGPFQGPLACTRIKLGKGVCGTAALEQKSFLVPDVEQFPGHIACSAESKSELVVPVLKGSELKMIIDVDSDKLNDFDEVDLHFFESLATPLSDL